jgi:hypothetical protein
MIMIMIMIIIIIIIIRIQRRLHELVAVVGQSRGVTRVLNPQHLDIQPDTTTISITPQTHNRPGILSPPLASHHMRYGKRRQWPLVNDRNDDN